MLLKVPDSEEWKEHLSQRWKEALELKIIIQNSEASSSDVSVFFLDHVDKDILKLLNPQQTMRSFAGPAYEIGRKWIKRDDLFQEAAVDISNRKKNNIQFFLYCYSDYHKIGDIILEENKHIDHNEYPLLYIEITGNNIEEVAILMRQSRSWRFLGVIVYGGVDVFRINQSYEGYFLCDAFDGDSLMIKEF